MGTGVCYEGGNGGRAGWGDGEVPETSGYLCLLYFWLYEYFDMFLGSARIQKFERDFKFFTSPKARSRLIT